jgi:microcystin-dependent protein
MLSTSNIPIGFMAMFGGDLSNASKKTALIAAGWLPCDGASYSTSKYPELAAVIGTAHGGDANEFNVPDLTGRFARGTTGTSTVDPDAGSRIAAAPGGVTGSAVGSLQVSATALPRKAWVLAPDGDHYHSYPHLNNDMHEAWDGSTYTMARWSTTATVGAAGGHFHTLSGGDGATVPVSVALYWIVRATSGRASGQSPAGALAAYGASAATQSPPGWLLCNGIAKALSSSSPAFASALGTNFGGDGVSVFNIPDLRGQFLRGTNHSTARDPNAASRFALLGGGNTGDAVGSAQHFATSIGTTPFAIAAAGAHSHATPLVPVNDHHAAWGAIGPAAKNCMEWTSDWTNTTNSGTHTHDVTGGDKETRPVNIYLDWIIANDVVADAPPIGTITAYGGDVTSIDNLMELMSIGWLPCSGQGLNKENPVYKPLYERIGGVFGEDILGFRLPDLRGYFVQGAGTKTAIGTVLANSTTGQPINAFQTTPVGDHTHQVGGIPTDTHNIDVVAGVDLAENNPNSTASSVAGNHTHTVLSGGDAESRPVNINVDYIIRFK